MYITALLEEPRYVMNLKLHHKQKANELPGALFLARFHNENDTKVVKNTLPGNEKLEIYKTQSNLGGVSLVGLSL